MDKKINKKALILSLIFALAACVLVINYIRSLTKPVIEVPKAKLIVASRDIEAGEQIKASDLKIIEVSGDSLPSGILNDRKSIEGFYAQAPIITGEPFREERLSTKEELSLSYNIPKGMRALTLFVNEDHLFSQQLRVGDRIDVIGSYEVVAPDQTKTNTSIIFLQDIEILSIGQSRVKNSSDTAKTTNDSNQAIRTVTLCVTPADAEKMAFTSTYATFSFILRGRGDTSKPETSGVIIEHLVPHLTIEQEVAEF